MLIDATADVTLPVLFVTPSTGAAADADSLPTFRVFGQNGPVGNGTGVLFESGAITAITVGSTTIITSNGHGLKVGSVVTIASAGGVTNVNGTRVVTAVTANTFSYTGVTSSGTYTSGGVWHSTGLYGVTLDSTIRAALEIGRTYTLITYGVFSSVVRQLTLYFTRVA